MGWLRDSREETEQRLNDPEFRYTELEFHRDMAIMKAEDTAAKESLRIALITNERNAGKVVEIAGVYRDYLFGDDDGRGIGNRIHALETAANVYGDDTPVEIVEAATTFAAHLNARG
jgi:hypothetical protein